MAFQGYLIKILQANNDYIIPLEYMNEKSYKGTLSTLDLDATRNANGVMQRNAILQVPHVSFETRALRNTDVGTLWSNIRSRYTIPMEKKVTASVYLTETDDYYTGSFYIPDTEMTINHVDIKERNGVFVSGTVFYEPITFEFIGYGEA